MSFISADNTWVLWAVMVGTASLSIWLEQTYQWASKVTGCVLALVLMMILRPQGLLGKREFSLSRLWERLTAMLKKPVPAGGKGEE